MNSAVNSIFLRVHEGNETKKFPLYGRRSKENRLRSYRSEKLSVLMPRHERVLLPNPTRH